MDTKAADKIGVNQRMQMRAITAGVFLLSLSMLVYEIALTRILSIVLMYHYAFLVISGALLGLSFGGVFEYFWSRRKQQIPDGETSLAWWASLVAVSMGVAIFLIVQAAGANSLLLLAAAAMLPFFFAGVTLVGVFKRFARESALLYAADLTGAALGAVVVVWALNLWGGLNSVLASSLGAALSAVAFGVSDTVTRRKIGTIFTATMVMLMIGGSSFFYPMIGEVPIGRDPNKDMFRILNDPSFDGKIIESRWSAFGRTDLVRFEKDPSSMTLFIDGAAGTAMYQWDGQTSVTEGPVAMLMQSFPGALPFLIMNDSQKDSAYIIGPGGGRDVLINLLAGVKQITAAEVNPEFVAIVQDYAAYNGGIYTDFDNVQVVVEEGRSYLKRSAQTYDIIMLSLPITKSSRNVEGYALTESFLFTKESIHEYFDHLTDEGAVIVITHDLTEAIRLTMTTLAALQDQGVSVPDAMQRIYLLGHPMMPVVVLNKRPLSPEKAQTLHAALHLAGFDGRMSYIPYAKQVVLDLGISEGVDTVWRMMNQNMIDLAEGNIQPEQLVASTAIDISPVSDDQPFFYKFEPGIPNRIMALFWGVMLLSVAMIVVAWMVQRKAGYRSNVCTISMNVIIVFAGLGVGFMMLEITLFNKMVLLIGHPTFALSLLLFSLLIGTGMGSLITRLIPDNQLWTGLWVASLSIALSVFGLMVLVGSSFDNVMFLVPVILVVVLGVMLGVPFPLAIRLLKHIGQSDHIPWAWAVNGAASVVGSVLVIMIAIHWGYQSAFAVSGSVYFSVALLTIFNRNRYCVVRDAQLISDIEVN